MASEIADIKGLVRNWLSDEELCRNSDKRLMHCIWTYTQGLNLNDWNEFRGGLCAESITRVRREVQNVDGEFLPTDPMILVQRGIQEDLIRRYYGEKHSVTLKYFDSKYGVN